MLSSFIYQVFISSGVSYGDSDSLLVWLGSNFKYCLFSYENCPFWNEHGQIVLLGKSSNLYLLLLKFTFEIAAIAAIAAIDSFYGYF